ncbi:hypothetical protein PybrP1_004295 [[Pythium] brassicae (nom. inval.)]|nr:hypothetical protein PybrP1_004295 [[Pythium] brassicae (nom. inval.)]
MTIADWCSRITQCGGGDLHLQVVEPTATEVAQLTPRERRVRGAGATAAAVVEVDSEFMRTSGSTLASSESNANGSRRRPSRPRDDEEPHTDGCDDDDDDDEENLDSSRSLAGLSTSRRLSALVRRRPRVPTISVTTLYNVLQTNGVVVVDCRDADEFALRHLPGALNCAYAKGRKKSVDDVIELAQNRALALKLAARDLMEVVVIGANRSSVLYKMDWGYRVARLLLAEGRVYSVRFLAQGFPLFARKYDFLLEPRAAAASHKRPPTVPAYPNEILEGLLFLGNFWQASSPDVLAALHITHVVNVGAPTADRVKLAHVAYLDIELPDRVDADLAATLAASAAFIDRAARESSGARVLVHCIQGVSRSASVVIWYVMVTTRCTLSAAYAHVLKCRPLVFPNHGFMQQLVAREAELYGSASVTPDEIDVLQNGLLEACDRASSQLRESFLT